MYPIYVVLVKRSLFLELHLISFFFHFNYKVLSNGFIKYFYGKQCECDNATCLTYQDQICGGPDRGTCDCGECVCKPEWIGRTCEKKCSTDTDQCYDKNDPTQVG